MVGVRIDYHTIHNKVNSSHPQKDIVGLTTICHQPMPFVQGDCHLSSSRPCSSMGLSCDIGVSTNDLGGTHHPSKDRGRSSNNSSSILSINMIDGCSSRNPSKRSNPCIGIVQDPVLSIANIPKVNKTEIGSCSTNQTDGSLACNIAKQVDRLSRRSSDIGLASDTDLSCRRENMTVKYSQPFGCCSIETHHVHIVIIEDFPLRSHDPNLKKVQFHSPQGG